MVAPIPVVFIKKHHKSCRILIIGNANIPSHEAQHVLHRFAASGAESAKIGMLQKKSTGREKGEKAVSPVKYIY